MSKPTLRIHAHWQVAQIHPANQNLPKSMAAPTHGRQESAAKLIDKNDKNKNGQLLTSGHKTLGVKWLIKRSTSHQGLVSWDTFAAPKSPTFHTADRQTVQKLGTIRIGIQEKKEILAAMEDKFSFCTDSRLAETVNNHTAYNET